ncbi:hypothetical protein M9H77_07325 [Catharanthus roseus]|uniref:Uncharacterized protein n=2 Tax=Catharanthus roseus TaxID=4058 RepID=A0ACC0BUN0_CATRO|nr:hypothetical protein M9H77_07325 [Catharanthus roseus]
MPSVLVFRTKKDATLCVGDGVMERWRLPSGQVGPNQWSTSWIVIENPNMEELIEYLLIDQKSQGGGRNEKGKNVLAVQINFFNCGGIGIGVQMSHRIGDGTSLVTFMNTWAATCRGVKEISKPIFDISKLFPPQNLHSFGLKPHNWISKEKIVTKRFLFKKQNIEKLKEAIVSDLESKVTDPSRVEAVTSFIWRKMIKIHKTKVGKESTFAISHAVNMRPRMTQIRNINRDHNICEYMIKTLKSMSDTISKEEIEYCNFSSWCRFPVYQVDCGWGKPVWVSTTTFPLKNIAILMSNRNGDGIEAWINMAEDDALIFSRNQMDFSCIAPNDTKII